MPEHLTRTLGRSSPGLTSTLLPTTRRSVAPGITDCIATDGRRASRWRDRLRGSLGNSGALKGEARLVFGSARASAPEGRLPMAGRRTTPRLRGRGVAGHFERGDGGRRCWRKWRRYGVDGSARARPMWRDTRPGGAGGALPIPITARAGYSDRGHGDLVDAPPPRSTNLRRLRSRKGQHGDRRSLPRCRRRQSSPTFAQDKPFQAGREAQFGVLGGAASPRGHVRLAGRVEHSQG